MVSKRCIAMGMDTEVASHLAEDVKVVGTEGGVRVVKGLEEGIHVVGDADLIVIKVGAV